MRTINDCSTKEIKNILKPRNWWDRYNKTMLSEKDYTTYMLLKQHDFNFIYSLENGNKTIMWYFCCRKCGETLTSNASSNHNLINKCGPDFCNILCLTEDELMIKDIIE